MNLHFCGNTPSFLLFEDYPLIEQRMTAVRHELPPAVTMAGDSDQKPPFDGGVFGNHVEAHLDFSLGRQLSAVWDEPAAVTDGKIVVRPDAICLTANSAIPVGDAVRGFFAERGEEPPVLAYVGVSSEDKAIFNFADALCKYDFLESEKKRLSVQLGGAEHVAVIDQFVFSGRTQYFSNLILKHAGVEQVTAINGRWYQQAGAVHTETLSSAFHKEFMFRVGAASANV